MAKKKSHKKSPNKQPIKITAASESKHKGMIPDIEAYLTATVSNNISLTPLPTIPKSCSITSLCQIWVEAVSTKQHNVTILTAHFRPALSTWLQQNQQQIQRLPKTILFTMLFIAIHEDAASEFETICLELDDDTIIELLYDRDSKQYANDWIDYIDCNFTYLLFSLSDLAPRCTYTLLDKTKHARAGQQNISFEDRTQFFYEYCPNLTIDLLIIRALEIDHIDCANRLFQYCDISVVSIALINAIFDYFNRMSDALTHNPILIDTCKQLVHNFITIENANDDHFTPLNEEIFSISLLESPPSFVTCLELVMIDEYKHTEQNEYFTLAWDTYLSIIHIKKQSDNNIIDKREDNLRLSGDIALQLLKKNSKKLTGKNVCNPSEDIINIVTHTSFADISTLNLKTLTLLLSLTIINDLTVSTDYSYKLIIAIYDKLMSETPEEVLKLLAKSCTHHFKRSDQESTAIQNTVTLCSLMLNSADIVICYHLFDYCPQAITLVDVTIGDSALNRKLEFLYSLCQAKISLKEITANSSILSKTKHQLKLHLLSRFNRSLHEFISKSDNECIVDANYTTIIKLQYITHHPNISLKMVHEQIVLLSKLDKNFFTCTLHTVLRTQDSAVIYTLLSYIERTKKSTIADIISDNIDHISCALTIAYHRELYQLVISYCDRDVFKDSISNCNSLIINRLYFFTKLNDDASIKTCLHGLYLSMKLEWGSIITHEMSILLNLIEQLIYTKPYLFEQLNLSPIELLKNMMPYLNIMVIKPDLHKLSRQMLTYIRKQLSILQPNHLFISLLDTYIPTAHPPKPLLHTAINFKQTRSTLQYLIDSGHYTRAKAFMYYHHIEDLEPTQKNTQQLTSLLIMAYALQDKTLLSTCIEQPIALSCNPISAHNTIFCSLAKYTPDDQLMLPYQVIPKLSFDIQPQECQLEIITLNQPASTYGHAPIYLALLSVIDQLNNVLIDKLIRYFDSDTIYFQAASAGPLSALQILTLLYQAKLHSTKADALYEKYHTTLCKLARTLPLDILMQIPDPLLYQYYLLLNPKASDKLALDQILPTILKRNDRDALTSIIKRHPKSLMTTIEIHGQKVTPYHYVCEQVINRAEPDYRPLLALILDLVTPDQIDMEPLKNIFLVEQSLLANCNISCLAAFISIAYDSDTLCQLFIKHAQTCDIDKLQSLLTKLDVSVLNILHTYVNTDCLLKTMLNDVILLAKTAHADLEALWHSQQHKFATIVSKIEKRVSNKHKKLLASFKQCHDLEWLKQQPSFEKEMNSTAQFISQLQAAIDDYVYYCQKRHLEYIPFSTQTCQSLQEQLNITLESHLCQLQHSQHGLISALELNLEKHINTTLDHAQIIARRIELLSAEAPESDPITQQLSLLSQHIAQSHQQHQKYNALIQTLKIHKNFTHLDDHFADTIASIRALPGQLADSLSKKQHAIQAICATKVSQPLTPPNSPADMLTSIPMSVQSHASNSNLSRDLEPIEVSSPILTHAPNQLQPKPKPHVPQLQIAHMNQMALQLQQLRQQFMRLTAELQHRQPILQWVPVYYPVVSVPPQIIVCTQPMLFQRPALEVYFYHIHIAALENYDHCFAITLPEQLITAYTACDGKPTPRVTTLWVSCVELAQSQPDIRECRLAINPAQNILSITGKHCHNAIIIPNLTLGYEQNAIVISHQFPHKSTPEIILQAHVAQQLIETKAIQAN